MIHGIAGNAFSAITLPPENLIDTEMNALKIIKVSRERYATAIYELKVKLSEQAVYQPSLTENHAYGKFEIEVIKNENQKTQC